MRLDNRLPPLQASGPQKPRPRDRDLNLVHWDLHDAIVEAAFDLQDERDFEPTVRKLVGTFPIAWTRCLVTFRELQATIATESEPLGEVSLAHANHCLGMLSNSEEWPFLQTLVATQSDGMTSLEVLEEQFRAFADHGVPPTDAVPRDIGKHRIVLHAFSGRCRLGDIRVFMEELQKQSADGTLLHVVSLDLMTDAVWGDATRPATKAFWRQAADTGRVHGLLAGPPCESWSQARFAQTDEGTGPRPIRSADALWGMES